MNARDLKKNQEWYALKQELKEAGTWMVTTTFSEYLRKQADLKRRLAVNILRQDDIQEIHTVARAARAASHAVMMASLAALIESGAVDGVHEEINHIYFDGEDFEIHHKKVRQMLLDYQKTEEASHYKFLGALLGLARYEQQYDWNPQEEAA